jgi:hypothetical protein
MRYGTIFILDKDKFEEDCSWKSVIKNTGSRVKNILKQV